MTEHKFKHVKVRLNSDQCDNLRLLAVYLGKPIAALMREVVDGYLFANDIVLNQAKARLICIQDRCTHVISMKPPESKECELSPVEQKLDMLLKFLAGQ